MKHGIILGIAVLATALFSDARGEEIVREFQGTGNLVTPVFEVESPWLLDWRLNGEYETMLAIDIRLLDGVTGRHIGQILHTKRRGDGVKLFKTGGSYKLQIDSTLARWDLKVIQITEAEAELYTPRKNSK